MNIIFAGTPPFANIQLQALLKLKANFKDDFNHFNHFNHFNIVAVYTQPDRPVGRGLKMQASPVKETALNAGLPIEQPMNFKSIEAQEKFKSYHADLLIVSAYGLLLPKVILDIPTIGCWNVHASLLPRWRGAAPIQQAILSGDTHTGITLMQMDEGLDTGAMLSSATLPINPKDTSAILHEKLAHLGAKLLTSFLKESVFNHLDCANNLNNLKNKILSTPQDNTQATLAPKISKTQAKLNWNQEAITLLRAILAFNPWPVAYTQLGDIIIKIWDAEYIPNPNASFSSNTPGTIVAQSSLGIDVLTGEGLLRLTEIQLPGKRKMPVSEVLKSKSGLFAVGNRFD